MRYLHAAVLCLMLLGLSSTYAEKPRVFVLTDIENEPDDAMSLERFLTYANHFDMKGVGTGKDSLRRLKVRCCYRISP